MRSGTIASYKGGSASYSPRGGLTQNQFQPYTQQTQTQTQFRDGHGRDWQPPHQRIGDWQEPQTQEAPVTPRPTGAIGEAWLPGMHTIGCDTCGGARHTFKTCAVSIKRKQAEIQAACNNLKDEVNAVQDPLLKHALIEKIKRVLDLHAHRCYHFGECYFCKYDKPVAAQPTVETTL